MLALTALARAAPLVVAAHTVQPGTELTAADLYVAQVPEAFVPPNTFSDPSELVGWPVRERLEAHAAIRSERLASEAGVHGLLPEGLQAVTVPPRTMGTTRVELGGWVDVGRRDRGCVLVQAALVLAVDEDAIVLAVPPEDVAGFAALPAGSVQVWMRNPGDTGIVEGLRSCSEPPAGSVVRADEVPVLKAPHGKAQVRALLEGQNAWVGELWLDPGAKVPRHRDPTEEFLVVLAGSGTITLDGKEHPVEPGTAVYMPAHAEVTYTNGDVRLHVVQVFAGPAPAQKYRTWTE